MGNYTLELLISAVNKEPKALIERMNINNDAIIVNQISDKAGQGYSEIYLDNIVGTAEKESQSSKTESVIENNSDKDAKHLTKKSTGVGGGERQFSDKSLIKVYNLCERGVGLSRNTALMRASADICLFCDDDIIYESDAGERIIKEFEAHPEADMLLFNVEVKQSRRTYHTDSFGKVSLHNCGRYPAYSFAIKREKMHEKNLSFSLLFGGGARYSNGEDSLFIRDCIKRGLRVYKTPVTIGREEAEGSTWFSGYHEKFFFDRGVLYRHLYGSLAIPIALRFILKHRKLMCREIKWPKAFTIMCSGINNKS